MFKQQLRVHLYFTFHRASTTPPITSIRYQVTMVLLIHRVIFHSNSPQEIVHGFEGDYEVLHHLHFPLSPP